MPLDATKRGRAHLRLVPDDDDWPVDLVPFLEFARARLLEPPAPSPSPEVRAFLEEPAHGKVDAQGSFVEPGEPDALALAPLPARVPPARRRLVAAAGAAAALVLVGLAVRPALVSSPDERIIGPATTAPAPTSPSSSREATTTVPTTARVSPAAAIGSLADEVPPPSTAATSTTPSRPPPTTAAPTTKAPAPKPPRTTVPTAPAPPPPVPAATPEEIVLQYFHAANARGKCVAKQPKGSSREQLVAVCGPELVPPPNLLQYWAARDRWLDCAQPLLDRGAAASKVADRCGPRPDRAAFGVPPNPYSASPSG